MAIDITKPDNEADTLVNLAISGNRLVSICNAVQQLMHETGKIQYPWFQELDQVVERVRDQLGDQRMRKNFPDWKPTHTILPAAVLADDEDYNRDLKLRVRDGQVGSGMKHR